EIGAINMRIERARLATKALDFRAHRDPSAGDLRAERQRLEELTASEQGRYAVKQEELQKMVEKASGPTLVLRAASGEEKEIRLLDIYRAYPANALTGMQRAGIYFARLGGFLWDDPREANTEGGIFPAIF